MSYLKHVLAHKWRMMFQGLPLWTALLHDLDKLWPDEFIPYARTFGKGGRKYARTDEFYRAWRLHQRRSQHHWQSWLVLDEDGTWTALPMPALYRHEMLADWMTVSAAHGRSVQEWYREHRDRIILHPETRAWVARELYLAQQYEFVKASA